MLRSLYIISLLLLLSFAGAAQCEKTFKLKTERIVTINQDSTEGEELPFNAEIRLSRDSIVILIVLPDGTDAQISGRHTAVDCKMNADYSSGSIEYKTDATVDKGDQARTLKMIFSVRAKDGKMKIFGVPEDQPGEKICFYIRDKEEIK